MFISLLSEAIGHFIFLLVAFHMHIYSKHKEHCFASSFEMCACTRACFSGRCRWWRLDGNFLLLPSFRCKSFYRTHISVFLLFSLSLTVCLSIRHLAWFFIHLKPNRFVYVQAVPHCGRIEVKFIETVFGCNWKLACAGTSMFC